MCAKFSMPVTHKTETKIHAIVMSTFVIDFTDILDMIVEFV